MPKPTTTTEGRDYGKRLYVSRQSYQKQMRRLTDAHRDRGARVPHSESKKPYLPDQGYQEMEYFDTPWGGPNFPGYPGYPDDPGINDDPEVDGFHAGENNPPKDPRLKQLGCMFFADFRPIIISPGDFATAHLERWEDPIVRFEVFGPGKVTVSGNAADCTQTSQRGRREPGGYNGPSQTGDSDCIVIVRADKNIDYDKWGSKGNTILIIVVAHTLSGSACSSPVWVLKCENVYPMTWDTDLSGTTIIQNGSCAVAILGGFGPYKWAVSGTGFSMQTASTPIDGRTNVLLADGTACGVAIVTVTDNCGNTVTGDVRCTTGAWVEISENTNCVYGGEETSYSCRGTFVTSDHTREGTRYKCMSTYVSYIIHSANCGDCYSPCTYGTCRTCEPCVIGRIDYCYPMTGEFPCGVHPGVPGYTYCFCESGFTCHEWRCS